MDIRNIKTLSDLTGYFSEELGWEIDTDDFIDIEDITYDFSADALDCTTLLQLPDGFLTLHRLGENGNMHVKRRSKPCQVLV